MFTTWNVIHKYFVQIYQFEVKNVTPQKPVHPHTFWGAYCIVGGSWSCIFGLMVNLLEKFVWYCGNARKMWYMQTRTWIVYDTSRFCIVRGGESFLHKIKSLGWFLVFCDPILHCSYFSHRSIPLMCFYLSMNCLHIQQCKFKKQKKPKPPRGIFRFLFFSQSI